MLITTRLVTHRTNTETPWFQETDYYKNSYQPAIQSYLNSGELYMSYIVDTTNLSLFQTTTVKDLEMLSTVETLQSVEYLVNYKQYTEQHGIIFDSQSLTGIDTPFTCTTVYTASESGNAYFAEFLEIVKTNATSHLVSIDNTDTTITLVHQYSSSTDYTFATPRWTDYLYCEDLLANNITRNLTYNNVA